ncbi:MAG: MATE family efflux transporter, partial [Oscillospiraceae bacterium]|nr:MATE family efflux transporter [Oscillospiraceae bacterium]
PIATMLTAVSNLFGVGGASTLAQALGRKDPKSVREISSVSFWFGLFSSAVFCLLFSLLRRPLLQLCGATAETIGPALGYVRWVVIYGGCFSILNSLLANLIRAEGGAAAASRGISLGAILNIMLDPFFVLPRYLGMGAEGAGLATAIATVCTSLYFAIYLLRQRQSSVLSFQPELLRVGVRHLKRILTVGLPAALQFGLAVIAVAAQSNFVSRYGTEAMAALGIIKKLDQLPLFVAQGTGTGLLPLLAYNYASGDQERRKSAFRFGCSFAFGFAMLCLVVYEFFAPALVSIFIRDSLTIEYGAAFLRRMVVAMPLMSIGYCSTVHFQAMGHAREALVVTVIRKGLLDIPLLWLMDNIYPLYGCMWVQPIVDLIAVIAVFIFNRRIRLREGL